MQKEKKGKQIEYIECEDTAVYLVYYRRYHRYYYNSNYIDTGAAKLCVLHD